jgi:hypothetical protein
LNKKNEIIKYSIVQKNIFVIHFLQTLPPIKYNNIKMKEKAHILNLTLLIEVIYIINPKFHNNNLNNIDLCNKNHNIHQKIYKINKLNINHNNNN